MNELRQFRYTQMVHCTEVYIHVDSLIHVLGRFPTILPLHRSVGLGQPRSVYLQGGNLETGAGTGMGVVLH